MSKSDKFIFKKHDVIGYADAIEDSEFLDSCFVDRGDIAILTRCEDPRGVVVGRTGSGKTALLQRIKNSEERAIEVKPESLALSYISNSTILNFLFELGVHLDVFYKLLWRHVFSVEIIKHYFKIHCEADKATFLQKITMMRSEERRVGKECRSRWSPDH